MSARRSHERHGLTLALLLVCAAAPTLAQGWQGIVPLKSTRADVEQRLGRPKKSTANVSIYNFSGGEVFVVYSGGPCSTNPEGWDVPKDIVINITVTPVPRPKISELKLNGQDYKWKRDEEVSDFAYYINEDAGITYEVDTRDDVVKGITYSPTSKQAALRCPGARESIVKTFKFGEHPGVRLNRNSKLLNDFVNTLTKYDYTYAYLIVYEDSFITAKVALTHRRAIKGYLINTLHLDARRVKIIDGGCRQKSAVELYVVPSGGYPPAATPDRECDRK